MDMIQFKDYIDYLRWYATTQSDSNKSKNQKIFLISKDTVTSQFRYINKFYNKLLEKEIFRLNPLYGISISEIFTYIENILDKSEKKEIEITTEDIRLAFELINKTRHQLRNRIILSLLLYGIDRVEITNLKNDDYNGISLQILTDKGKRIIPLSIRICNMIDDYIIEKSGYKGKSGYLFINSNGTKLNDKYITKYMNEYILKKVSAELTVEKLQQFLIRKLIDNSRDIISLVYITGLSFTRMDSIIDWERICHLAKPSRIIKDHPFIDYI
jgi:site-specific recombinase XerD